MNPSKGKCVQIININQLPIKFLNHWQLGIQRRALLKCGIDLLDRQGKTRIGFNPSGPLMAQQIIFQSKATLISSPLQLCARSGRIPQSAAAYAGRQRIERLAKFMLWAVVHLPSLIVQLAELSFVNHVAHRTVDLSLCHPHHFCPGSHCSVFCESLPSLKTIQG